MPSPEEAAEIVELTAGFWSSVTPPNPAGKEIAKQFAGTVEAFAALRGGLAFEQEPSGFLAALQETKEIQP